jgi:hypothetical protein
LEAHNASIFKGEDGDSTKMAAFWVVALCSLVEVNQHFRDPCCLHHQGALMMEAARTSETLVNFYQTTWHYNPEDSHLHTHRCEILKSYMETVSFTEPASPHGVTTQNTNTDR